jgi:hypothetical protein
MKLNIQVYNTPPRIEKVKLNSDLAELLDFYVQYYQHEYKSSINIEYVMVEMMKAFIKSDRNFMRWYREKESDVKDA